MFVSKVRKRFVKALSVFLYFSFLFFNVNAKTGKLIPLPVQEPIVLFAVDGKQTFCVTEHTVLVESKGIFVAQYTSAPLITAACLAQGKLWLGTESGLIMVDKTTFAIQPIVVPGGSTIRMFSDGKDKIWLGTDEYGLFSIVDNKAQKEQSFQNIVSGKVVNNTVFVLSTDTLWHNINNKWFGTSKPQYLVETADDSLQRVLFDNNGLFWVIIGQRTAIYEPTTDSSQTLKQKLVLQNNGMFLTDYVYVPNTGFLWATTRGLFFHRHNNVANPIEGQKFETIANMVGKDMTEEFCRATGFRIAERIYLDPDGKSVWFINWNGALQVEIKQLQGFF